MENEENTQSIQQGELTQAKEFAKSTSLEDIRSGEWFAKLLHLALRTYREKVNTAYFQEKYPGLPPDAIVDRRIDLAKKYAALEGGSTAAAYTVAVAATIGSHGGASPLTVPAAFTAFAVDLGLISLLQLHLAYDISVIYGKPLDYEDPEDLYDLLVLAFGIKAGETFSVSLQKLSPEAVRVLIKKTVTGSRLEWLKALPVVGKFLLQRNIIKTAIPVVGIGLGSGINYFYTGSIGKRAKKMFRMRGAIEEAADQVSLDSLEYSYLFLQTIWLVMSADKHVQQEEAWYWRSLIAGLEEIDIDGKVKQDFEAKINIDEEIVMDQLRTLSPEFSTEIYNAACVASVVDGKLKDNELKFLQKLAEICSCKFDKRALSKLASEFHSKA
jgi:uncharacterized protein (DUF697 family)